MERKVLAYQFDDVKVDLRRFQVLKAGEPAKIEPRAYEVLLYLIENRAGVVEKSELLDTIWKDSFVTENALTRVIAQLRKGLGDAKEPKYIATVHKRGYRFVADAVAEYEAEPAPVAAPTRPARRVPSAWRWRVAGAGLALVVAIIVASAAYYMAPGRSTEAQSLESLGPSGRARAASPRAYEAYLRGTYHSSSQSADELRKSVDHFEAAISEDADYAPAYAGLADAYSLLGASGFIPPGEAFPKAKQAAVAALALGGESADAYTSLAAARMNYDWDWVEAERELDRAVELDPKYPKAHVVRSQYLLWIGFTNEAVKEATLARDLDPIGHTAALNLGWTYYYARRYDEAIDEFRKALDLDPTFAPALYGLGEAYEAKGMLDEAVETLERAKEAGGNYPSSSLAHALGLAGRHAEASREIASLTALSTEQYVSPYYIAIAYLGTGDAERALAWMGKACDERSGTLVSVRANPRFDRLRADPRFKSLLERIGPHT